MVFCVFQTRLLSNFFEEILKIWLSNAVVLSFD